MNAPDRITPHDASDFPEAVLRAQASFRTLMRAMSEPGLIETMPGAHLCPAPLMPAAAAVLTTLCDFETSLWVAPELSAASDWLRFETDARLVAHPLEAAFSLVTAQALDLAQFPAGDPAYPDRGATIIVQCPALAGGPEHMLAGPGIAATRRFAVAGLPDGFAAQAKANQALFPLGVDLIFVSGDALTALPRSTRMLETR